MQLKENDLKRGILSKPITYWSLAKSAIEGSKNLFKKNDFELKKDFEQLLKETVKK